MFVLCLMSALHVFLVLLVSAFLLRHARPLIVVGVSSCAICAMMSDSTLSYVVPLFGCQLSGVPNLLWVVWRVVLPIFGCPVVWCVVERWGDLVVV